MRIGALEAGGTKMVMTVSDEELRILARKTVPTDAPEDTMPAIVKFFSVQGIDALGVGSFGPLDLNPASPDYGSITETPKLKWRRYPLLKTLQEALHVPTALDTDVNAAALCEARMGAAKGLNNCVYFTVGTGVGAGVLCEGKLVHGMMHPEWGHMLLSPHPKDPMPQGVCPYHRGCLEGLASGPSLEKRWGVPGRELKEDHIAWEIEAYYLAQACASAFIILSTEKVILGGGVMAQRHLFPMIREETKKLLGGYLPCVKNMDDLICPPKCYPDSGMLGALMLGKQALEELILNHA